jgi:pimeloyl-ACP methyl ester carboxylesterase
MNRSAGQRSASATPPLPFEWELPSTHGALRGLHWPGGPTSVLLVHDIGGTFDLDSWHDLPEILNQAGYTVCAIDLPGHGLSDGTFADGLGSQAIALALRHTLSLTGHAAAIVTAGQAMRLLDRALVTAQPVRALVALSPPVVPGLAGVFPKLAFVGAVDEQSRTAANQFLHASRGWTLVSSFGTREQSHHLLESPHAQALVNQMIAFLRDYRVPASRQ